VPHHNGGSGMVAEAHDALERHTDCISRSNAAAAQRARGEALARGRARGNAAQTGGRS
jgi:hypothetical protein